MSCNGTRTEAFPIVSTRGHRLTHPSVSSNPALLCISRDSHELQEQPNGRHRSGLSCSCWWWCSALPQHTGDISQRRLLAQEADFQNVHGRLLGVRTAAALAWTHDLQASLAVEVFCRFHSCTSLQAILSGKQWRRSQLRRMELHTPATICSWLPHAFQQFTYSLLQAFDE